MDHAHPSTWNQYEEGTVNSEQSQPPNTLSFLMEDFAGGNGKNNSLKGKATCHL